jgi:hypothetical protein
MKYFHYQVVNRIKQLSQTFCLGCNCLQVLWYPFSALTSSGLWLIDDYFDYTCHDLILNQTDEN